MKVAASILFVLLVGIVEGQESIAELKVKVMNFEKSVRPGETVVFESEDKSVKTSGISNSEGKCVVKLPGGHTYDIYVQKLGIQIKNNQIKIPKLQEGAQYADAELSIFFEMPRQLTLDNLQFDTGKSTIQSSSYNQLNQLADYLKNNPKKQLMIHGFTDNVGDDKSNLTLSQHRANAVKKYLENKNISSNRMIAQGYGENNPIADNSTEAGRKQNRRTEIVFN